MGGARPAWPVGPRGAAPAPKAAPVVGVKRKWSAVDVSSPRPPPPNPQAAAAVAAASERLRQQREQAVQQQAALQAQQVSGAAKLNAKPKLAAKPVGRQAEGKSSLVKATVVKKKATEWAKKSKWPKKNAGAASGGGLSPAEKQAIQAINTHVKSGDLSSLIAATKEAVSAGGGAAIAASQTMHKILELAAKKAAPAQYGEVLDCCQQLDFRMDATNFTKLLVILTSRIPVPTGMVRLTLNLALPADGQVVPLIPPDATEEDVKAVFEDGEPLTADRRGPAIPEAPAKELGPRPQVKDEQEEQDARVTLTKVQPDALRGCVDARDAAMRAYFGHFCALLHLETLVELRQLKQRLQKPPEELERFGWMVRDLTVRMCDVRTVNVRGAKGSSLPGRDVVNKKARVVFALDRATDTSRLRLRSGDSVLLSRTDPMVDMFVEGIIADAPNTDEDGAPSRMPGWEERIVVTFDADFDETAGKKGTWRLDRGANRTAYERQMMALLKMATAKDEKRLALWDLLALTGVGGSNVDAWASKMQAMLNDKQKASLEAGQSDGSTAEPGAADGQSKAQLSPAERRLQMLAAEEPPMQMRMLLPQVREKMLNGSASELNPSQREAVAAALGRRLSLVQGPPGTGKTTVSVQLLGTWAKDLRLKPLLATSDSNIAVDNIAEGVQSLGLKVVRVGRPEKVTSHLEDITLESIMRVRMEEKQKQEQKAKELQEQQAKQQQGQQQEQQGEEEQQQQEDGASSSNAQPSDSGDAGFKGGFKGGFVKGCKGSKGFKGSGKGLKGSSLSLAAMDREEAKRRRVDEFEAKMAILREADVVCTTTIAAGSDFLHLLKFQAILIDEVAQATELSAIVPIALRGAERLVLVGDHCQLPPSICSLEAETRGLSLSIFGRLAAQGIDPYFLDTQFRMHPMIAAFSAQEFYHGRLKTGIDASIRPPPAGFDWPQSGSGIVFLHVDAAERREGESRTNPSEASVLAEVLLRVLAVQELSVLEVGVVSPYSAQVRALRTLLRRELPSRLRGTGVDLTGGLEGRRGARALEIASVDAFQGREKDLIIFSAVRSNPHGNVGFLADWRRLNVMITRARRGLIIIGNTTTLRGDPTWARWLDWAQQSGLVQDGMQLYQKLRTMQPPETHVGRSDDRYGGRPDDRRYGDRPDDRRYGGRPDDRRYGDRPDDRRYGGRSDDRYGGRSDDRRYGDRGDGRYGDRDGRYGRRPDDRYGDRADSRHGGRGEDRYGSRTDDRRTATDAGLAGEAAGAPTGPGRGMETEAVQMPADGAQMSAEQMAAAGMMGVDPMQMQTGQLLAGLMGVPPMGMGMGMAAPSDQANPFGFPGIYAQAMSGMYPGYFGMPAAVAGTAMAGWPSPAGQMPLPDPALGGAYVSQFYDFYGAQTGGIAATVPTQAPSELDAAEAAAAAARAASADAYQ